MDVRRYDTDPAGLAAWHELALPVLAADPVVNTFALTALAERARSGAGPAPATLATVHDDGGATVAAALRFAGHGLQVSALPAGAADALAAELAGDEPLWRRGAFGPVERVAALVRARVGGTGEIPVTDIEMRLWTLGTLVVPRGVAGTARAATDADGPLLARWFRGFVADVATDHPGRPVPVPVPVPGPDGPDTAGPDDPGQDRAAPGHAPGTVPDPGPDPGTAPGHDRGGSAPGPGDGGPDPARFVADERAAGRDPVVWEVDGTPVAFGVTRLPAAGVARIGPVYTPPEHRNHGYAPAVTAACVRRALAAGAREVVLFTDVAADVPNRIYARIGFVPGGLHREVRFEPAPDRTPHAAPTTTGRG
ncbi:GCN5-related N-acetyltransferase [Pseudonocardia dioxanivorans CB1190]|uniref:GCN5-related N-acetyltransferase n=1 Tax=Pseudonocardia dioxanivorans (strain ATCC 55486 / DSM 44775 / JCM 13855 / CB1190) TaxID=675635 RepID=F4CPV0_PSEUX|nr:GNAT family N-acetyltransferase [Pseudonocardia dioxanivorans]AEA26133.1 GCN5-related N-acetyltransferase [Pseudonocardia dioxanivorans CB1190]